mmetsp:Transcript_46977/g.77749  ORF Transcript_46977/g.77749 Transcript_46977/m.77749 type:complete len:418 (-) Transcript_46977:283-1536(-)|eukprot:CAMPEP_0119307866 /NCGR_PEP_ID=MMETSP1333-20130426/8238_1 /TAXON_ID=418940 /ORGANISM="Scyphosphaera apsteinii, Strain RCC1455" /LENGTH=417 /DNA_ID=CAMNT_0007311503 /DNA_START=25 /DNA_END=1278 /DNA_ORIENTATION=+
MSDFKDILGLPRQNSGESTPAPRPSKQTIKKPAGMSREVFALLHQDASSTGVPLVPTPAPEDTFKEKQSRIIGWESKQFTNSARTDDLRLRHWVKNNDKSNSYTFARFNKKIKVLSYTDAEYELHLAQPNWSKEDTDQLFELCRSFDLRWPVIHDRFLEGRTLDQLKERYYDVCRLLLSARLAIAEPSAATELSQHPLSRFRFDARHERERRAEFERLYSRTEAEVMEELRRLEQAKLLEAKLKAQKKALKPGGRAASLAALKAALSASGLSSGGELAVSGLPSLAGLIEPPKRHRNVGVQVTLRSKDVSNKKPASEKQLTQFEGRMRELSMPTRVLATEENVQLYNHCRANVVLLVELESKLKRLEYERNVMALRNQQAQTGAQPSPNATAQTPHSSGHGKRARSESHTSQKRSHH